MIKGTFDVCLFGGKLHSNYSDLIRLLSTMSIALQKILRVRQLSQKLLWIIIICACGLLFLSFPKFPLFEINQKSPNNGDIYNDQYYNHLLMKWLNNSGGSERERELLTDDNIIGDIVRNIFVEDQMFPGGEYGFAENELGKEDIYGQLGAHLS